VQKRAEPLIPQGLNFILALFALCLTASEVFLRYDEGVWMGVCGLWHHNGDAECGGVLSITYGGGE
jgi:hypothetical protein